MQILDLAKIPRRHISTAICLAVLCATMGVASAQSTTTSSATAPAAAPKKQKPADEREFEKARAVIEPEARFAALQNFIKDFPDSHFVNRVHWGLLDTLTKNFPQRADAIHQQAAAIIDKSDKDLSRAYTESEVADKLANAGTSGADLTSAEHWAKDAVQRMDKTAFTSWDVDSYKQAKLPLPASTAIDAEFSEDRAGMLAVLANVYLRQGKNDQAAALLKQAYALDPTIDEVNALLGEMALTAHRDDEALNYFERAQLSGELKDSLRQKMFALYRAQHGGSLDGFEQAMDARYAQLFPAPFEPAKHAATTGNRTVLLELFTGSGCSPCIGADISADALLDTYSRKQLILLSYDQHIPQPDPLANPDSVARGKYYDIMGTPTFALDGKKQEANGASRAEAKKNIYDKLTPKIDAELAVAAPVDLQLSANTIPDGTINVTSKTHNLSTDGAKNQHRVVNIALVEDHIRYSGQNGIRFHSMVVRALAKPAGSGFALDSAKDTTVTTSFDPKAISAKLSSYLDNYENHNDRFGKITFLSKDTQMDPSHLAVVAYVEDTDTHKILQSTLILPQAQARTN